VLHTEGLIKRIKIRGVTIVYPAFGGQDGVVTDVMGKNNVTSRAIKASYE
jgi:hypothetical protein